MPKNSSQAQVAISPSGALAGLIVANSTVFASAFCIMVIELVAGRVVAPYIGSTLYTWTSIIGVVLAGIAGGNYVGGRIADRFATDPPATRRIIGLLFVIAGIGSAGINLYCDLVGGLGLGRVLTWWPAHVAVHVLLVFFLPSALLGTISPVVAKMALDQGRQVGRTIGSVYAWGVVGSIFGTFMTGFYFIAEFRVSRIILSVSAFLVATGALYLLASLFRSGRRD